MATFGDDTAGTVNDSFLANQFQLRKFTGFTGGAVSAMSMDALYYQAGGKFRCFIYDANGASGKMGALLWSSTEFAMTSGMTTHAFREVTKYGGGTTNIPAQDLWLGAMFGGGVYIGDSTAGGTGLFSDSGMGISYSSTAEPSNPYATSYTSTTYSILQRIYLTYTPPVVGFVGMTVTRLLQG